MRPHRATKPDARVSSGRLNRFLLLVFVGTLALPTGTARSEIVAKAKRKAPVAAALNHGELTRVIVEAKLPLQRLTSVANQFDFKAQTKGVTNVVLIGDVHYDGSGVVEKVSLTASQKKQFPIELKAPFRWAGTIGVFDVKADGDVTVDFAINVGPDWCPLVELDDSVVELYPEKAINLARVPYAKTIIRNAVDAALKKQLNCQTLKKAVAELWHAAAVPVQIGDKKFVININPATVAVTGVAVVDNRLLFKAAVDLATVLSSKTIKVDTTTPLPNPEANPPSASKGDGDAEISVSLKLGLDFQ
jgi:hypothetical protein